MGTNKRYGSDLTDAVILEALTRPRPIGLSDLERGDVAPREAADPIDVDAWVRFPETPVRVRARAVAWTDRAVLVEFSMRSGATHRVWVWASAVERVARHPD